MVCPFLTHEKSLLLQQRDPLVWQKPLDTAEHRSGWCLVKNTWLAFPQFKQFPEFSFRNGYWNLKVILLIHSLILRYLMKTVLNVGCLWSHIDLLWITTTLKNLGDRWAFIPLHLLYRRISFCCRFSEFHSSDQQRHRPSLSETTD